LTLRPSLSSTSGFQGVGMQACGWIRAVLTVCAAVPAFATAEPAPLPLVQPLLQGCLAPPSVRSAGDLAVSMKAIPYSNARIRREIGHRDVSTVADDITHPEEAQRTETTVTAFLGWDLAEVGAGSIEYAETNYRVVRIETRTGQTLTPWRISRSKRCLIRAPVADAREVLETYEKLQPFWLGILVSADRRWVSFFTFDPDQYDIELHLRLSKPLKGLAPGHGEDLTRILLNDGGRRYETDPGPAVRTLRMDRAALLAGLQGPAEMDFMNETIEPIVQRLSVRAGDPPG
jgi:hypothetical protein